MIVKGSIIDSGRSSDLADSEPFKTFADDQFVGDSKRFAFPVLGTGALDDFVRIINLENCSSLIPASIEELRLFPFIRNMPLLIRSTG